MDFLQCGRLAASSAESPDVPVDVIDTAQAGLTLALVAAVWVRHSIREAGLNILHVRTVAGAVRHKYYGHESDYSVCGVRLHWVLAILSLVTILPLVTVLSLLVTILSLLVTILSLLVTILLVTGLSVLDLSGVAAWAQEVARAVSGAGHDGQGVGDDVDGERLRTHGRVRRRLDSRAGWLAVRTVVCNKINIVN